jgi:hypothetical protein
VLLLCLCARQAHCALASLMTSSASAVVAVAADRKVADPLRSAIGSALASSLLVDLSAIVADYARTAFVDWDCATCLDPPLITEIAYACSLWPEIPPSLWSLSDHPEQPRMTVTLPETVQFVWLCGRARCGAPPSSVRCRPLHSGFH